MTTSVLDRLDEPPAMPAQAQVRGGRSVVAGVVAAAFLCLVHTAAVWVGVGGWAGLTSPWSIAQHDHPLYFHSALVTRSFLHQSGTTAGYDPSFMAGYPKSVVWPTSSTLPELVVLAFGGTRPELAYKLYVFAGVAAVPWLIWLSAAFWKLKPGATAVGLLFFLLYLWTDFPIQYAIFGMVPYLVGIPVGLVATGLLAAFLARGGSVRWFAAVIVSSVALLAHPTTAMIVAPAAILAYVWALWQNRSLGAALPASRQIGLWLIPLIVAALNAFWWLPGVFLANTKGASGFVLAHSSESVVERLTHIFTSEASIEAILWALGPLGFLALIWRDRVAGAAMTGFLAAGFFWGYLAGAFPGLDFLQPGRHTYALYSGLALLAGLGLADLFLLLRTSHRSLAIVAAAGLLLLGSRLFAQPVRGVFASYLAGPAPFLSSQPSARLRWVLDRVKRTVKPGERLLYEEAGKGFASIPDVFRGGRYSGLLPHLTGVEVIGGPYLHVSLTNNFTQFGEGKLFGETNWDRNQFVRYARLYRPSAILCWTPWARRFCRSNPDLIEVLDVLDLRAEGAILIGRVKGFGGSTISGHAKVAAEPGRLHVSELTAELDGRVILRYHFAPYLRSSRPAGLEPVLLEQDPVPFIGLRPAPHSGPITLEMDLPPGRSLRSAP